MQTQKHAHKYVLYTSVHKNTNCTLCIQTHLTRVCLSAYTHSNHTWIVLSFHISRRCFFGCQNNTETFAVTPGESSVSQNIDSRQFPSSSSAPQTMPHPLGNIMMNTITAAAAESCLRG